MAGYLLNYKLPEECVDTRFGVKEYMSPKINDLAGIDNKYAYVLDLIKIFKEKQCLDEGESWEGNCSELIMLLSKVDGCNVLLKDVNARKLGWGLAHLASKGVDGIKKSAIQGSHKWVISEPTKSLETTTS